MGQAIQSLTPKLNKIIVWIQKAESDNYDFS